MSSNHNDAFGNFGVFSNTFYDPFPNTKWKWFENNFSGHPVWGTGGGTDELGQKLGKDGQRDNPIYANEMVFPIGGGGGKAQYNFLKYSRDLTGGYLHGDQVGKFDDQYNYKYIRYQQEDHNINLFDSTITKKIITLHLVGDPHKVDRQVDSLNRIYYQKEALKNSYLKSWGK
ncbi:hypothetical protein [Flavobacterium sp. Root186]|uniref:hypothetical protein n=1 Tax=Flavobacterium sp. Root186 TaxID=1736485 RepID=UPI0006F52279|nr:hypothetical protein [Flavobacterium sp. Root186]KRB56718.1 hypothetical protein ASD98_08485 [Flavobacterium sp. Root186]